jgi:hypothetical protein
VSYVYFIRDDTSRNVKVGTARNPRRRLAALQTGSASPLSFIGAVVGGRAREKELHEQFRQYHRRGEWFDGSAPMMAMIWQLLGEPGALMNPGAPAV